MFYQKKSKYKNHIIKKDGVIYQSKKEYLRYLILKHQEKTGIISDLIIKPTFILIDSFIDSDGKKHRAKKMVPDFQYFRKSDNKTVVEDVKADMALTKKMSNYQTKKKLFLSKYPQFKFEEYY